MANRAEPSRNSSLASTDGLRTTPRRNRPDPATYLELATQAQEDPENDLAGPFDQVAAAFHRGDLSSEQYGILAEAMAESMRAEDRQNAESAESG